MRLTVLGRLCVWLLIATVFVLLVIGGVTVGWWVMRPDCWFWGCV